MAVIELDLFLAWQVLGLQLHQGLMNTEKR
jgi:hypothetical protein